MMKSKDNKPIFQPNKQRDITGQKFGKLTGVKFLYRDKNYNHFWEFRCDCGNTHIARKSTVIRGDTTMCKKCTRKRLVEKGITHGKSGTRLYREWGSMIQRCENSKSTSYERYGAIGISVCKEWHDFTVFEKWALSNGYKDDLTIDRIKSGGNYEPSNCRWTDVLTQNNNQKQNVRFNYMGEEHTLAEWARLYGMNYHCFYARWQKTHDPQKLFNGYERRS